MRRPLQADLAWIGIATALLLTMHSSNSIRLSPEDFYRSIDQAFVSGNLARSETLSRLLPAEIEQSNDRWREKFRLQRAKVLLYQGRQEAMNLLLSPIAMSVPDPALEITRSSLLAIAYGRASQLPEAKEALAKAERWCTSELDCSEIRLAQGVVDLEQGDLSDAQDAFERCLKSSRIKRDAFQQSQALLNLGVVAERLEHYDEALARFNEASALAARVGIGLALEKATGSAGWAFYKLGDYRRALEQSRLAERQAAFLGAQIDEGEWLNNSGLSEFRLGDLSRAKSFYEDSYKLARSLQNDEEIGDALLALAYLSLEKGDLTDALSKSREVERLAAQRGNPDDALEPSLIEALALARQGQSAAEAKAKLLALEANTAPGESVRWAAEGAIAGLYADAGDSATADAWYRRAIATFRLQRSSLSSIDSRLPFLENGSSLYLGYVDQLIHEGKPDAALAVLDQSRAETLAEDLGFAPQNSARGATAHPQALARRLGGTILVYCLRPSTSYLWAIGPQRSGFFRLPGQEVILPLVAAHAQAILSSKDVLAQPNAPGLALYRELVEPAASLIGPQSRVFLIADEALNELNFETLMAPGATPHFWIEDADIVNARSISLLAAGPVQHKSSPKRLLLVGDPVYDRPEEATLTHAEDEMARVAEHFSPDRRMVLAGAAANPVAYQASHPESYAYIHFVAHATASEIDPLDSSVLLSAAPGAANAYKLYARSILAERLNADLVTVSSCYGSGVRSYSGEGLVGLAWAFLHSGSHHVIGALWEVSDASTPLLMSAMYDSLSADNPPDVALRSAKLAMLHGGGVFRKPFYWAAFQLYVGA